MAMSGKGLSKEAFSLCSLKGQKQQNGFSEEEENNLLISILFILLVWFPSLESYGQINLKATSPFFPPPPVYYQFLIVESFLREFFHVLSMLSNHSSKSGCKYYKHCGWNQGSYILLLPSHASCQSAYHLISELSAKYETRGCDNRERWIRHECVTELINKIQ